MTPENDSPTALARTADEAALQALKALSAWEAMASGAYAANTRRAWRADAKGFQAFCEGEGSEFLPATPDTVRRFVQHCQSIGKKPTTIARAHLAAGLTSPCASEPVRLALKAMGQQTSARQDQARGLVWVEIKQFIDSAGEGLRADRERALLCVAYDGAPGRARRVRYR